MKVVWSETDIKQIRQYAKIIENDKPKAASKWIKDVFAKESNISDFPLLGRVVPEFNKTSIREIIFKNHRIIYRIQENDILITTVQSFKKEL